MHLFQRTSKRRAACSHIGANECSKTADCDHTGVYDQSIHPYTYTYQYTFMLKLNLILIYLKRVIINQLECNVNLQPQANAARLVYAPCHPLINLSLPNNNYQEVVLSD